MAGMPVPNGGNANGSCGPYTFRNRSGATGNSLWTPSHGAAADRMWPERESGATFDTIATTLRRTGVYLDIGFPDAACPCYGGPPQTPMRIAEPNGGEQPGAGALNGQKGGRERQLGATKPQRNLVFRP